MRQGQSPAFDDVESVVQFSDLCENIDEEREHTIVTRK